MISTAPLILYATHDGHTLRIVNHLARSLKEAGTDPLVHNIAMSHPPLFLMDEAPEIVLIAPIRYGHHLPAMEHFISAHRAFFRLRPPIMVSVNLTARKQDKNEPETNPYFKKWIQRHRLTPSVGLVLGGRLDYRQYAWWEKWAIRLIMSLTGGPTDPATSIDYTDWGKVEALAESLHDRVQKRLAA